MPDSVYVITVTNTEEQLIALERIVRTHGAQAVADTVRHMNDQDRTFRQLKTLASLLP